MDFKILLKILPFTFLLLAGRYLKEASATAAAESKPVEILVQNTAQPVSMVVVAAADKEIKPLTEKRL